ncbi:DoxX family membrane protein [Rhodobacteraceae bacterium NNCM2]|nr:DoxX family membrane protein [Coraliihabitans acroporae]
MTDRVREALACLILRVGLGWFIFVWAVNKLLAPAQYQDLANWIDRVDLSLAQVYAVAIIQIIVCICVFIGWQRIVSYGILIVIHGYTIYRQLPRYLDPFEINDKGFPVNRNATDALAVLFAMVALWLLRSRDRWSLDCWLESRRHSA